MIKDFIKFTIKSMILFGIGTIGYIIGAESNKMVDNHNSF